MYRRDGKCAIIADGTYDSSKKEATVLLMRYIEVDEQGSPRPVERLADVFTCDDTSGEQLCRSHRITESSGRGHTVRGWTRL